MPVVSEPATIRMSIGGVQLDPFYVEPVEAVSRRTLTATVTFNFSPEASARLHAVLSVFWRDVMFDHAAIDRWESEGGRCPS